MTDKEIAEHFERKMVEALDRSMVASLIADVDWTPRKLTFKERVMDAMKNAPRKLWSYITRYQIVDTWHVHDYCDD